MRRLRLVWKNTSEIVANLRKVMSFAWHNDRGLFIGAFATTILGSIFPLIFNYLYKLLIDHLVIASGSAVTIPLAVVFVLAAIYTNQLVADFISWGLSRIYFFVLFRSKLENALTVKFFTKVSSLDVAHLENPKTEDLITKTQDSFNWRVVEFIEEVKWLIGNLVSYVVSFVLLLPFGVLIPFIITLVSFPRLYLRSKYGDVQWSTYSSNAPEVRLMWYLRWILSSKDAIIESKLFQSTGEIIKKLSYAQDKVYRKVKKPTSHFMKIIIVPQTMEVIVTFALSLAILPRVLSGELSVGDFTFFITVLMQFGNGAAGIVLNIGTLYESNLYVNSFYEVMNLPKLIKDPVNPVKLGKPRPVSIEFKNVTFKYQGNDKPALNNISFTVDPGENVALVGPNGAGKTTVVKLLCRFYDPMKGKILIDGTDLKDVNLKEWYRFLGSLFQNFIQYNFTVKENITLGDADKNNLDLMKKAAKLSGAEAFIEELPKKYNQLLGRQFEGGMELSQGQWQKLAIARAFYENAPILILDEPTSAIDAETEYEIFNNLDKYYQNKSLLLVSHRFSTVRNADKIIVLDKGKITEQGNHQALMKKMGLYQRMFTKQAIGYK